MENSTPQTKRIYVLVDRTVPSKGLPARSCFWDRVLGTAAEMQSISDSKEELRKTPNREPVRIDLADFVIVNWDAANGDYACGSDDVLLYFLTRDDRRTALLADGGILLCEFQSGKGVLHQRAYDAIFGEGEVSVFRAMLGQARKPASNESAKREQEKADAEAHGATANKFEGYNNHPLIRDLPRTLESRFQDDGDHIFNFSDDYKIFQAYKDAASQLWRGWFVKWEKGWVPLLVAVSQTADVSRAVPFWKRFAIIAPRYFRSQFERRFRMPPAILLAKVEGRGLMLASTMWIAGSRCQALVDQIVKPSIVEEVRKAHRQISFRRGIQDLLWLTLILAVYVWAFRKYFLYFHSAPESWRWKAIGDVGFTWLLIIAFRFWKHFLRDRPYGANFFQFFEFARKSFWDTL
jgi:hypothetical protein